MSSQVTAPRPKQKSAKSLVATYAPWGMCVLVCVFYWYDYFLRVMPSVMISPLMASYQLSVFQVGVLASSYYYVYTPLQLLVGALIDKYDRRLLLFITCLVSALGAFLFAVPNSLAAATVGRMLMGVGSAFAFVGALKLASMRLPQQHFALFVGILVFFGILGAVAADFFLSRGVMLVGWQSTSMMTAIGGVGLAILLYLFVKDRPRWLPKAPMEKRSVKALLAETFKQFTQLHIWLVGLLGGFLLLPVSVFASLWWILFLKQGYHMDTIAAAQATAFVFIGFGIGAPSFAWWSGKIKRRRLPVILGASVVFVFSCIAIYWSGLPWPVLVVLFFCIGFFAAAHPLLFAIAKELSSPRLIGVTMAAVNFLVSGSAMIFQPWVGLSLARHAKVHEGLVMSGGYTLSDYHQAFAVLVAFLFVSVVLAFFLPETHCQSSTHNAKRLNALRIGGDA